MKLQTVHKFLCLFCFYIYANFASCKQLDNDIAKYSIFSKSGNYDEVKDILKQIRDKGLQTRMATEKLNDFLMKSPVVGQEEQIATSFDDGGGGTEISSNAQFIEDVFEGDIVLTVPQARSLLQESNGRQKRKVMRDLIGRWPTKNINYAFDSTISGLKRTLILAGIKHWEDNTCLTFTESHSGDHLLFVSGSGCYSNVGHVGGVQEVSLGPGCDALGVIAHEIGHILGFWHEQSRPDRERYIRINMNNVIRNAEGNFDRLPESMVNDYGVAYDLGSAMHYGAYAFSSSLTKRTIDTLDPNYQTTIGQRQHLSFIDIKQMNRVYCSSVCNSNLQCLHGGYPDPNGNGFKCRFCKCPEGFGGNLCQTVEPSRSNCGGELVARPEWQTLSTSGIDKECNWLIKGPSNSKIRIEFSSLDMQCSEVCKSYVGLKYKDNFEQSASRFCCGQSHSPVVSTTNELIVLYRVDIHGKPSSSFNSRYKIEGDNLNPVHPVNPNKRPFTSRPFHQENPMLPLPGPSEIIPVSMWSDWSAWTTCSEKCGGCGIMQRRRQCGGNNCPGYDLQRSNCNNQVCPKQQNDLNPQQQQQTTCSYPKQVPCNRRRRFGRLNDDVLDDFSSQYQDLIKSLPDYQGGEINVGPEIEAQQAHLSRKRRQIVDDSRVVMVQSQSSGRNSQTYCIRYIQYACNSNSAWKLNDANFNQPRAPCCSGYEQIGNICRRRL